MVIDTSAIVAILFQEPETQSLIKALVADAKRIMSSFSALEAHVVVQVKKGPAGGRELDLFLHEAQIEIVNFTADQMKIAKEAYFKFGKGHHKASLNIGDCCSYALAKYSGEPLLFKGRDFAKTDIIAVEF